MSILLIHTVKPNQFIIYAKCFLGGSLIEHGGQNPLEATRYGCKVLHGPNINNFREIYNYLSSLKLSHEISNNRKPLIC